MEGGDALIVIHGRSLKAIGPRILIMQGRSASGFTYQADIAGTYGRKGEGRGGEAGGGRGGEGTVK